MATRTLSFPSPYPTSMVLTSLTRVDTGASVTGSITATGNPGAYTLSITEPAAGLTYAYTLTGTWADGSTRPASGTVSTTSAPQSNLATVQAILTALYAARLQIISNGGLASVTIDGEQSVFQSAASIDASIQFWERKVAMLSGTRRRSMSIRLDGCF